jgi:hypothetical protein
MHTLHRPPEARPRGPRGQNGGDDHRELVPGAFFLHHLHSNFAELGDGIVIGFPDGTRKQATGAGAVARTAGLALACEQTRID